MIIATKKIGVYDAESNGIVLDVRNIKLEGTMSLIRYDSPELHLNIHADFYVFQPKVGALLKGVVKHISKKHVSALIYNVFNVSIRLNGDFKRKLQVNREITIRMKKFDLQNVLPYIEGELVSGQDDNADSGIGSGSKSALNKSMKFTTDSSSSDSDSEDEKAFKNLVVKTETRKATSSSSSSDDESSEDEKPTVSVVKREPKREEKDDSSSSSDESSSGSEEIPCAQTKVLLPSPKIVKKETDSSSSASESSVSGSEQANIKTTFDVKGILKQHMVADKVVQSTPLNHSKTVPVSPAKPQKVQTKPKSSSESSSDDDNQFKLPPINMANVLAMSQKLSSESPKKRSPVKAKKAPAIVKTEMELSQELGGSDKSKKSPVKKLKSPTVKTINELRQELAGSESPKKKTPVKKQKPTAVVKTEKEVTKTASPVKKVTAKKVTTKATTNKAVQRQKSTSSKSEPPPVNILSLLEPNIDPAEPPSPKKKAVKKEKEASPLKSPSPTKMPFTTVSETDKKFTKKMADAKVKPTKKPTAKKDQSTTMKKSGDCSSSDDDLGFVAPTINLNNSIADLVSQIYTSKMSTDDDSGAVSSKKKNKRKASDTNAPSKSKKKSDLAEHDISSFIASRLLSSTLIDPATPPKAKKTKKTTESSQ